MQHLNLTNPEELDIILTPTCITTDGVIGLCANIEGNIINSFHYLGSNSDGENNGLTIEQVVINCQNYISNLLNNQFIVKCKLSEYSTSEQRYLNLPFSNFFDLSNKNDLSTLSVFTHLDFTPMEQLKSVINQIRELGSVYVPAGAIDIQSGVSTETIIHFKDLSISTSKLCIRCPVTLPNLVVFGKLYIIEVHQGDKNLRVGYELDKVLRVIGREDLLNDLITALEDFNNIKVDNYCYLPLAYLSKDMVRMTAQMMYRKSIGIAIHAYPDVIPEGDYYTNVLYKSKLFSKEDFSTPKYVIPGYKYTLLELLHSQNLIPNSVTLNELTSDYIFTDVCSYACTKMPVLTVLRDTILKLRARDIQSVVDLMRKYYHSTQDMKLEVWLNLALVHLNFDYFSNVTRDTGSLFIDPNVIEYKSLRRESSDIFTIELSSYTPRNPKQRIRKE